MKMKKMIAAVFAAALVAAGTGLTGLAADPAPQGIVFDTPEFDDGFDDAFDDASDDTDMISLMSESGNESDSDADKVVSAAPGEIVIPETLGLDAEMKEAFEELLDFKGYKELLKGRTIVDQYKDEIDRVFPNANKIEVFIEVELKRVALDDNGKIQYVRYYVAPKARGFENGSWSEPRKLGKDCKMGDEAEIPLPVPEDFIAKGAEEGVYMIRDGVPPYYRYPSLYEAAPGGNWFWALRDDNGGFGEVIIVPSRWHIFDDEYYHMVDEGTFWVGTDSLTKGTSVTVSFNGFPFDKIENPFEEYIDCEISAAGGSVIITGKKDTKGYGCFYLIRELKGGLEFRMPFNVRVIDAPHSSGSSSSSDEGNGSSASAEPESSGGWEVGEKGWWYRLKDGTYPAGGWMSLEWRGKTDWYYFGAEGYMVSGWFTDADGNRYFLHDKTDGTQGYMYTGWHEIGGKWYYFSEVTGGPLGSLLVNTTTPDGYQVGADGAWIP